MKKNYPQLASKNRVGAARGAGGRPGWVGKNGARVRADLDLPAAAVSRASERQINNVQLTHSYGVDVLARETLYLYHHLTD